jgi:enterochelin esterase-like enzyme
MKRIITSVIFLFIISGIFAQNPDSLNSKPASTNVVGAVYPRVDAQRRVIFRINAPKAQSVSVSLGNTELTKGEDGYWTGITQPQDPGFLCYSIKIDGIELNDPASETFYDAGHIFSCIEIPEEGIDFYDFKDVPHGEVRSVWYKAKTTGETRHAYIYTPPGYDENPTHRYPVLYLLHGMNQDRRAWAQQGRANFILDNLIAEGKAKPMILVMEDGGIAGMSGFGRRPAQRPNTPGQNQPGQGGNRAPVQTPGGAANFWDAYCKTLVTDVIPMVDSKYRTLANREHRAIAGLSLGGAQTYQITQANLDLFANIGVFSAAPFGYSGIETAYNGLLTKPDEFAKKVKVFFISQGSKEGANAGRGIHEDLLKAGIKHYYYEAPGTAHVFQTWRKSLHGFAQLLFQK